MDKEGLTLEQIKEIYVGKINDTYTLNLAVSMLENYDELLKKYEEKDKETERLKNELSIKTTYIEDVLKTILKSDDFKMQREVYEHGIEYDKKLKELKEGKYEKNI